MSDIVDARCMSCICKEGASSPVRTVRRVRVDFWSRLESTAHSSRLFPGWVRSAESQNNQLRLTGPHSSRVQHYQGQGYAQKNPCTYPCTSLKSRAPSYTLGALDSTSKVLYFVISNFACATFHWLLRRCHCISQYNTAPSVWASK